MEIFSPEFFSALLAIIVIDLILAGDNAIVIALAARSLPPHLQKKAILWGTGGAIIVRALMTGIVVWLLKIPGLLFAGGLLLVWIAVKLLAPTEENKGEGHVAVSSFWGAMKTIVIADAVMGLDNVLAVAGAARDHPGILIIGLLLAVALMGVAANVLARYIERYRWIAWLGLVVILYVAGKMIYDGFVDPSVGITTLFT